MLAAGDENECYMNNFYDQQQSTGVPNLLMALWQYQGIKLSLVIHGKLLANIFYWLQMFFFKGFHFSR